MGRYWWNTYRVTIRAFEGDIATYAIVTAHGELKAAAMAGAIHQAKGRGRVWQVEVVDEGPIPTDASGVAIIPDDAYPDRMEW